MRIKRWIANESTGTMFGHSPNTPMRAVVEHLVDESCSQDIVEEILFEGEDGKHYKCHVQLSIEEADPDHVRRELAAKEVYHIIVEERYRKVLDIAADSKEEAVEIACDSDIVMHEANYVTDSFTILSATNDT